MDDVTVSAPFVCCSGRHSWATIHRTARAMASALAGLSPRACSVTPGDVQARRLRRRDSEGCCRLRFAGVSGGCSGALRGKSRVLLRSRTTEMPNLSRTIIERRRDPRRSTAENVYIYWPRRLSCRCQMTSLSASGAFLDIGPLHIPVGASVELAFVLGRGTLLKMHRRTGIVVRSAEEGLGVMFLRRRRAQRR